MMVVNSLVNYKLSSTDVAKKLEELVLANFSDKVWTDRTCFEWKIANRLEIEGMLKYFARYPSRSHKVHRLVVVPRLYELKEKRAYKASNPDHTEWLDLLAAWKRWG